jgi:hypothetical protein
MKSKIYTLTIVAAACMIFLAAKNSFSQENIEVRVEKAAMSKGLQTGYVVNIPMAVLKDVQNNWIKKLQENIKTKVVINKDELLLSRVVIGEITSDTISIYSLLIQNDSSVAMNVFVEIDSVFFNSSVDESNLPVEKIDRGIINYIRDFAVGQYRISAENKLEEEQKLFEELENDLADLEKENEDMKKEISSLENSIEKTEREISSLEQEIDLKNQEVLSHKTSMQLLATEEEKKAAKEKDKELEKEKSKLEKERTGLKNDISDMKSDISKNEKGIEDNIKLQEEKQAEIDARKEVVIKAQALLEGIK